MARKYTDAIGEFILKQKASGATNGEIVQALRQEFSIDTCKRTIRKWAKRARQDVGMPIEIHNNNHDFYENLWDVLSQRPVTHILVLNDLHFPYHDPQVVELALQIADHFKPAIIERGSDELDCPNISRFATTANELSTDYMMKSLLLSQRFSRDLISQLGFIPFMPFKIGNHDRRFLHFAESVAPQVHNLLLSYFLEGIQEKASLVFSGWDWDGYEIQDLYLSIHGWKATKFTADKYLAQFVHRIIVSGHVHRIQAYSAAPVASLQHNMVQDRMSYTTGCACLINPQYNNDASRSQNWQQGFGLATYNHLTQTVAFENVIVMRDGDQKLCQIGGKIFRSSTRGWQ